jgi:hypothetical protein
MTVSLNVSIVSRVLVVGCQSVAGSQRRSSVVFARPEQLAKTIAEALQSGKTVVVDVDYQSKLFGDELTLREKVEQELGGESHLADNVINLDHHREYQESTATERVFDQLQILRNLEDTVSVITHHGDTDSVLSTYIAGHADRIFSAEEKSLLIAAARAGDHSEGDFLCPTVELAPSIRLNLAIDQLCFENKLPLNKVWGASDEQIRAGFSAAYTLVEQALASVKSLYSPEVERLIAANAIRSSYFQMRAAIAGDDSIPIRLAQVAPEGQPESYLVALVDASAPGYDNFNPITAYLADPKLTIILFQRGGRVVGIGRNEAFKNWLSLTGSDRVQGFYVRTGGRYKGGAFAGGANVARDKFETLLSPEEGLEIARQFLLESLVNRSV